MILILGGTSDANAIGDRLKALHIPFKLSVTSDYGLEMARRHSDELIIGRFDALGLVDYLKRKDVQLVIDATHPHAMEISKMAVAVAHDCSCYYMRYERPSIHVENDHFVTLVETVKEAVVAAREKGNRILVTGSKHLKEYTEGLVDKDVFVRVIPSPAVIQEALDYGIGADRIIAMKGPFTEKLNTALYEALNIQVLITKESGDAGGFMEKIRSAQACGVYVVVIKRPQMVYENCHHTIDAIEKAVVAVLKEI